MTEAAGNSQTGRRTNNQDAYLLNPALGLFLIADGVGGHASGEIASELACQIVNQRMASGDDLVAAIRAAHDGVCQAGNRYDRTGMATTMVAAKTQGTDLELAWVGDSRAFLWDGNLQQLTRDHSRVQEMVEAGLLTPDAAQSHPEARVLSQAIGASLVKELEVGYIERQCMAGQTVLMCTDGLWASLSPSEMASGLKGNQPAASLAQRLVQTALENGSQDNCTAVVIRV